ncbi:MAG: chloride channel protein [Nitrospirae bacterium]|nr:chloride channel protein [Nitrospirota bacterium]
MEVPRRGWRLRLPKLPRKRKPQGGGIIRFRSVLLKIIAPAITIGTGGSAGVEGPSAQIGGGVGSIIGQWLGFSGKRTTLLIASGSAGAIAAIFNAPIAGVMFATEIVLLGNYEMMSFGSVVISAGIATAVSRAYYGPNPAFTVPLYDVGGIVETPFYIFFGFFVSIVSVTFIKVFYKVKDFFGELNVHRFLKPIIGAFIVGVIGIFFHQVMSDGYTFIMDALNGNITISLLLILMIFKILATSVTLGSGGAGGVFAPSLFIGAMAGALYGTLVHWLFPHLTSVPGAYATIGIGTFLAAATHAPLTGIFLLFEMTGNYKLVLPIMFSSISAIFMASRLFKESIDTVELSRQGIDLSSGREMSILQQMRVQDIMNKTFTTVRESDTLAKVSDLIIKGKEMYFPVINAYGEMVGIISMHDVKSVFTEEHVKKIVTAGEIATEDVIVIRDIDNMIMALELFALKDIDEIPVVDFFDTKHVVGMLRRGDVLTAYNKEVLKRNAGPGHF